MTESLRWLTYVNFLGKKPVHIFVFSFGVHLCCCYKTMRTIRGHLFIQVLYTHSLGIKISVLAHKITKSFILTTTLFHTHKRTLQWFLQLWNRQEAPPQSLWQSDQWGENYYLKCVHTHKQGLVFHLVCFNLCKQKCLLFKTQETHTHPANGTASSFRTNSQEIKFHWDF